MKEKIRDNGEKIKQNKVLPYLVSNVVEVWIMLVRMLLAANHRLDSGTRPRRRRGWCEPRRRRFTKGQMRCY